MKLKNSIIKSLIDRGLEATTDHSLDYKHAYKVYNFRHEIIEANKKIEEKRVELVKAAGIENGQKFDERRKELEAKERTKDEQKEYEEILEKLNKFGELYGELMNDESEVNVKTIPFEEYHKLAGENKQVPISLPGKDGKPQTIYIDFFTMFREALENILWKAPEDDE